MSPQTTTQAWLLTSRTRPFLWRHRGSLMRKAANRLGAFKVRCWHQDRPKGLSFELTIMTTFCRNLLGRVGDEGKYGRGESAKAVVDGVRKF